MIEEKQNCKYRKANHYYFNVLYWREGKAVESLLRTLLYTRVISPAQIMPFLLQGLSLRVCTVNKYIPYVYKYEPRTWCVLSDDPQHQLRNQHFSLQNICCKVCTSEKKIGFVKYMNKKFPNFCSAFISLHTFDSIGTMFCDLFNILTHFDHFPRQLC